MYAVYSLVLILVTLKKWFFKLFIYEPVTEVDKDSYRTIEQFIESRGFRCECHKVTTSDGYVLSLHRIVNPNVQPGHPILLMHGLGGWAINWLFNDSEHLDTFDPETSNEQFDNALGFCLSKRGYDVWLGNLRATPHSRGHVSLDIEDDEYWNFSIDDYIKNDLPAKIGFILKTTGSRTLGYAGISLGNSVMFGLLSSNLKYNELIKPFVAIAPCYKLFNMRSPYKHLAKLIDYQWKRKPIVRPLFGTSTQMFFRTMTNGHFLAKFGQVLKMLVANTMSGYNFKKTNWKRLGVYGAHFNASHSGKQVAHSGQYIIKDIGLTKFDYGAEKNVELYGTETPPLYDISKITNKFMVFIYGANDWMLDLADVKFTIDQLSVPLVDDYLVPDPNWTHFDSLVATDSGQMVNSRIVHLLKRIFEGDKKF